tara:strand:- start:530 stop:1369 length:840 start_codon:yes stop_codon:yes gene_type:complete
MEGRRLIIEDVILARKNLASCAECIDFLYVLTDLDKTFDEVFYAKSPQARALMEVFDYLPMVHFYVKDCDHRYVCANRSVLTDVFGMEQKEDLMGRTDLDFQPPALAEAYHAEDRKVMEGGVAIPNQVWLVPHVHGMPKWYVSTKTPLFGAGGEVLGLAGVMYPITTPDEQAARFREIYPVISHFEQHFRSDVSMGEMARLAGLSSTQFNKRFRDLIRISPTAYLLRLRVQEAQRLLVESSAEIAEVAAETGFCDQSHFTKRFQKVTGMTPLRYRRRFR